MINGHSNDLSQARINGHSKEACRKQYLTKKMNGDLEDIVKRAHDTRSKLARKCILNDGFVGCYSEIKEHTGLSQGMVGMSMSKAFVRGSYTNKYGWTFQPWNGEGFDDKSRVLASKETKIRIGDVVDTVTNVARILNMKLNTIRSWANTARINGGTFIPSKGVFKGLKISVTELY